MTMRIMKENQELLECSSSMFDTLAYTFGELIREESVDNPEVINFVKKMQFCSETMFPAFYISDYIQTSEALIIIIDLLDNTIDIIQSTLTKQALLNLWKLHEHFIAYKEELIAQGK